MAGVCLFFIGRFSGIKRVGVGLGSGFGRMGCVLCSCWDVRRSFEGLGLCN